MLEWLELAMHRNANMDGEHMQHGRRLAVGDVGDQRGQVIVTRSMGCCIDADSKSIAAETFS